MKVLGIETSCDETGVAVYDSEAGLRSDALFSQIALHAEYGGVVPELASRDHVRKLLPLVRQVLEQAGLKVEDIDGVAYTSGPGLVGALMVGAAAGRALAWALDKPAIGVHHMPSPMGCWRPGRSGSSPVAGRRCVRRWRCACSASWSK